MATLIRLQDMTVEVRMPPDDERELAAIPRIAIGPPIRIRSEKMAALRGEQ